MAMMSIIMAACMRSGLVLTGVYHHEGFVVKEIYNYESYEWEL